MKASASPTAMANATGNVMPSCSIIHATVADSLYHH